MTFVSDKSALIKAITHETPCFIWDLGVFRSRVKFVQEVFSCVPNFQLYYAMKANSSPAIVQTVASLKIGVDVCSTGELKVAIDAGVQSEMISICPFAPSETEMNELSSSGCDLDLDSLEDLLTWCSVPDGKKTVGLRVNPDVQAGFHEHCASGVWDSKFGIPLSDLPKAISVTAEHSKTIVGLHIHIGSSSYEANSYLLAIERVLKAVKEYGLNLNYLNIGGGWGIPFNKQDDRDADERFPLEEYAVAISSLLQKYHMPKHLEVRAEPGEYLVGPCGFLVCSVRRIIERHNGARSRRIVVVDGGSYLYPGPSLYGSDNFVLLLNRDEENQCAQVLAGRSMMAGDYFGPERLMPRFRVGDVIAIGAAGAYSKVKSSNFNLLPNATEGCLQ